MNHLDALELRLSHERERLAASRTAGERALRTAWAEQIEREIAGERAFLGLAVDSRVDISDDELLAELSA
jgi:hypothetical protein